MGLLSDLLLFPVTGPVRGLQFVLEQIRAEAEAQLQNEGAIQAELMTLEHLHRRGEIYDEEYEAREAELLDELNAIRAYPEGRGGGDDHGVYDYDDYEEGDES